MSGKTLLLNATRLKQLVHGYAGTAPKDKGLRYVKAAVDQINRLNKKKRTCRCKGGGSRQRIYDDLRVQLKSLSDDELLPLKQYLGVDTLILGGGRTV